MLLSAWKSNISKWNTNRLLHQWLMLNKTSVSTLTLLKSIHYLTTSQWFTVLWVPVSSWVRYLASTGQIPCTLLRWVKHISLDGILNLLVCRNICVGNLGRVLHLNKKDFCFKSIHRTKEWEFLHVKYSLDIAWPRPIRIWPSWFSQLFLELCPWVC